MVAVRHLGVSKLGNFNGPSPSEGQNASLCQILCKSVKALQRYGRFRFFKMAAVRHLGFVIRLFEPSTKCILVVSVTVCKIWFESVQEFRQYASFNILGVKLESAYSRPFRGCLGVKNMRKSDFL